MLANGAVLLSAVEGHDPAEAEVEWRTGTAIDEFVAVQRILAQPTYWPKTHAVRRPGIPPGEVDAMDLTLVAVLMGVGVNKGANDRAELEAIAAARQRGEDVSWGDDEMDADNFAAFRRPRN